MKQKFFFILVLFLPLFLSSITPSQSQEKHWIFFTDKKGTKFNPFEYFDGKAIERRLKNNLPLYDSTDYPLNENYVQQVEQEVLSLTQRSRWFNAVAVWAYPHQINTIDKLPFVKSTQKIHLSTVPTGDSYDLDLNEEESELLINQTRRLKGNKFSSAGIDGKGIRIAIFDGGFPTVDTNPVFEHIRKENRIIKTYDFTKNEPFVYAYNKHGTMVLSCIAGKVDEKNIGLATGAEFLLARTEIYTEPYSEEENWLAAVEWADKNGADIINSSLGYTYHRYFIEDMDGETSLVVKAANMAARKGLLVLNAMGNSGTSDWHVLGTPADADSILSIGGIDPETDYHVSFSSYGPTADKRMKPNVSAYGIAIVAGKSKLRQAAGTSFATPLVTGFAACAWQTKPNLNNMEMFEEIEKSGHLYPYFDYVHGYGIPQASYFMDTTKRKTEPTFEIITENDSLVINIKESLIKKHAESKYPGENYLYYHLANPNGVLDKYAVVEVKKPNALKIALKDIAPNQTFRAWYRHYTLTKQISN